MVFPIWIDPKKCNGPKTDPANRLRSINTGVAYISGSNEENGFEGSQVANPHRVILTISAFASARRKALSIQNARLLWTLKSFD